MNSVQHIFSIAKNTFREAVRDRILYNLVIFVLLIIGCAIFLGELTAGQEARTIVNLGLNAMLLFGVFISIFVGVGLVSKEIEKRTLYTIFSKPIGRGEFIIGKYLGLCLTIFVNVLIMGIGVSFALLYVQSGSLAFSVWGGILLIFFQLAIITAVAILFSSFSSPSLSALLTFLIFIIGHFSSSLREFAENLGSQLLIYVLEAVYYIFPNLSHLSFVTNSANGDSVPASMLIGGFIYSAIYIAVLLAITILIFSRRNLK